MTKDEIIEYLYENHVRADFKIEEIAEDLAEPVRKGTWVSHWEHCEREKVLASGLTSYFWCSVCNMPSPEVTNFCPNCGAFMSEGETDD